MKDFNNKPRFGGNDRGGRPSFGGKPSFNRGSDRGFDRDRQMHSAKCDDCGKQCEVPFRPTGERPVYCNDCFGGKNDDRGAAFGKRDSGSRSYEKPAYTAKPAYTPSAAAPDARIDELKRQLESVNNKLDTLITVLENKNTAPVAKAVVAVAPKKAEKPGKKVVAKVVTKAAPKAVKKVAAKKKK
jgi:CxxC-x17-CxxC domain-containing protein